VKIEEKLNKIRASRPMNFFLIGSGRRRVREKLLVSHLMLFYSYVFKPLAPVNR
jgi:hypothetical protein